jgi:5'-3' exoribonuclease 2
MDAQSVYYDMPRSTNVHKSMLLRGVKLPPPTLNKGDIERTRNRAANSGRSYGGAPLRGGYGSGRGRPQDNRPLNPSPLPQTGGYGNYGNQSGYNGDNWRPSPSITQGSWLPPPPQPHRAPLQPPPGVRLGSVSYAYQPPHPHLVGQNYSGRAPPPPPYERYNDRSDGRPGDRRQGGEGYGDSQRYRSGYYSNQHDRRY